MIDGAILGGIEFNGENAPDEGLSFVVGERGWIDRAWIGLDGLSWRNGGEGEAGDSENHSHKGRFAMESGANFDAARLSCHAAVPMF
jgi:hypothetical protein